MSRPLCRNWAELIEALERRAATAAPGGSAHWDNDRSRVHRAARALASLQHDAGEPVSQSIRATLAASAGSPPPQTVALAAMTWPLVLTANLYDLYVAAVHQRLLGTRIGERPKTSDLERRTSPVLVAGRSATDCHRVLCSLTHPAPPILWALQGYLGGQATIDVRGKRHLYADWSVPYGLTAPHPQDSGPLASEIVVGHADYRRVASRAEGFRRTFAEVVRRRSLLFLGSGLAESYLLDLFGEIIELYGRAAHPHYAVARRDTTSTVICSDGSSASGSTRWTTTTNCRRHSRRCARTLPIGGGRSTAPALAG
jgi:SIR2-like domain